MLRIAQCDDSSRDYAALKIVQFYFTVHICLDMTLGKYQRSCWIATTRELIQTLGSPLQKGYGFTNTGIGREVSTNHSLLKVHTNVMRCIVM